jgi:hypothetical protein
MQQTAYRAGGDKFKKGMKVILVEESYQDTWLPSKDSLISKETYLLLLQQSIL